MQSLFKTGKLICFYQQMKIDLQLQLPHLPSLPPFQNDLKLRIQRNSEYNVSSILFQSNPLLETASTYQGGDKLLH